MSRTKRSYLPGAAFHLVSRTSGHEHWWADDRSRNAIVGFVADSLRRTDTRLIAFAVMTNHFHFTVRQGRDPLARFMQPVCRRVASLVQRTHDREGHIFERQFRDKPCADADHLRQAIYYIHRNPVKAGMCADASEYVWSSACMYTGVRPPAAEGITHPTLTPALELFARTANATADDMYAGYLDFARWRMACDELPEDAPKPAGPQFPWGDVYAGQRFRVLPPSELEHPVGDLRDLVQQALRELAPGLDLELLRLRRGPSVVTAVRREIIKRAKSAGHRGVVIARFLNVAESTVSRIATEIYIERMKRAARDDDDRSGTTRV